MSTQQHQHPTNPDDQAAHGVSRRTFTRAAAWSAPVVAVAVTAPAHAMSAPAGHDLHVAFEGTQYTSVPGGGDPAWARIPAVLEVSNLGTEDSPVGVVGTLTTDLSVLQMQAYHPDAIVTENPDSVEIVLPSVPGGGTLTVYLGALLDQEAAMALGRGDHPGLVAFVLAGTDGSAADDSASAPAVVTVDGGWDAP